MNEARKAWMDKGEDGVSTSPKEAWDRILEWARDGWTMPDSDYIGETVLDVDAELARLRKVAEKAEKVGRMRPARSLNPDVEFAIVLDELCTALRELRGKAGG